MKIALVGENYSATTVGGFVTLEKELIKRSKQVTNISFVVYGETKERHIIRTVSGETRIVLIPRKSRIGLFINRAKAVHDAVVNEKVDIVYLLGYASSLFINYNLLRRKGVKLVLNPDGLEWKRKKYNFLIRFLLLLSERVGVKKADFIIADSKEIKLYIEKKYRKHSIFIPYGFDSNTKHQPNDCELKEFHVEKNKYYIVVARCVPENNLIEIVDGFIRSSVNKRLLLVTDLPRTRYCKKLKKLCEKDNRVVLTGPIYNQDCLYYLRLNAFGYIHGHSVGGTNPSLVEAMGVGNIILAHKNRFNVEVLSSNLGYFFANQKELKERLEEVEKDKNSLAKKKGLIRERAVKLYNWDIVSSLYFKIFCELESSNKI